VLVYSAVVERGPVFDDVEVNFVFGILFLLLLLLVIFCLLHSFNLLLYGRKFYALFFFECFGWRVNRVK